MTDAEKFQTVRITNIQRFCLHDGPGIRTTVFLKGCSLHCPWCCNPENISYDLQPWHDADGMSGVYGYDITLEDLLTEINKDKVFYIDGGGVTLSGGEPLLQIEKCVPLLKELKDSGISVGMETALFVEQSAVMAALEYVDWWYVDMKLLVPETCRDVLGGDAEVYKNNLKVVVGKAKNCCIRIPCITGITDDPKNVRGIIKAIQENDIQSIELIEGHNLSERKYLTLGISNHFRPEDNQKAVLAIQDAFDHHGIPHKVIKL